MNQEGFKGQKFAPGSAPRNEKPLQERASRKRLMGLEPTTFCMAIST